MFRSGADLAASLISQSYAKLKFMGPPNSHDVNHPDALIKDFRAVLQDMQDSMHHVAQSRGWRDFFQIQCRNKTHILDEQLHVMELSIEHGMMVHVEGYAGEQ